MKWKKTIVPQMLRLKTYSTLIDGISKEGNFEGSTFMWNRMMSSGCKPNVVVYTWIRDFFGGSI